MAVLKIDVVSDVVCPWCYIGKRRLENALNELPKSTEIEIEYHPFELNPSVSQSGINLREHLVDKFGGEEQYDHQLDRTAYVAKQEGLEFNLKNQLLSPNTRKMHALIVGAKVLGIQKELTEAFFKAYFTDAIDLTQEETILEIAETSGMPREFAKSIMDSPERLKDVEMREQQYASMGITGVPFFIINEKYGVSGAQTSETFAKILREALEEASV